MTKKLPLGLQDFRGIIEDGYKYVDKTRYLHAMCTTGKYYFLSRPRRFGKSVTISTLAELFSGSRELFEGLWIADKWNWEKKYPVIRISFASIGFKNLGLEPAIVQQLHTIGEGHGIRLVKLGIAPMLRELLEKLATDAKVVLLIDEYDAPLTHYLGVDQEMAIRNRDTLKDFYSVLKDADEVLHFVLLTGVSRFSKVGIFSGLNNLRDISSSKDYATMLGYTQEELENNFNAEIADVAQSMETERESLLEKMRFWYNGYRFEENASRVYNPVSLNLFLEEKKFDNFWFETGTPTLLINMLRQKGLYNFSLEPVSQYALSSFEVEDINLYGLLYQTGYLTIKRRDEYGLYHLDYPNHEVKSSMIVYLMEAFSGLDKASGDALAVRMMLAFEAGDVDQVMGMLRGLFAGVPYQLYESAPERFFHASIHLLFLCLGMRVQSEVCTSDGRADSVVETSNRVYILEYKLDESAEAALRQIRDKAYFLPWFGRGKPVTGVGVSFSSEKRNIAEWKAAELLP